MAIKSDILKNDTEKVESLCKDTLKVSKNKSNSNEIVKAFNYNDIEQTVITVLGETHKVNLNSNIDFRTFFKKAKKHSICLVHNHPSCTGFSSEDLALFLKPEIKTLIAVSNKGKVFMLNKNDNFDIVKISDIIKSEYKITAMQTILLNMF